MKHQTLKMPQLSFPKLPWKGFLAGCFFLFFFLGILAANWAGQEKLAQYGLLNSYYVVQLAYAKLDAGAYFLYLCRRRLRVFALTALSVYTRFGVPALSGVIGWYAFSLGYLFVNALVCMKFQGMVLVLLSVFPQIILYAASCFGLGRILFRSSTELAMPLGMARIWRNPRIFLLLSSVICMIAGIWLEAYVNPVLLKSYIRRM